MKKLIALAFVVLAVAAAATAAGSDPSNDLFDEDYISQDVEETSEMEAMQSMLQDALACELGPRIAPGSKEEKLALAVWDVEDCPLRDQFPSEKGFRKWLGSKKVKKQYDPRKAFECKTILREILGKNGDKSNSSDEDDTNSDSSSSGDDTSSSSSDDSGDDSGDDDTTQCPFKNRKLGESCWAAALRYKGFGGNEQAPKNDKSGGAAKKTATKPKSTTWGEYQFPKIDGDSSTGFEKGYGSGIMQEINKSLPKVVTFKCPSGFKYSNKRKICFSTSPAVCGGNVSRCVCQPTRVLTPEQILKKMSGITSGKNMKSINKAVHHLHACWQALHGVQHASNVDSVSDGSTTHVVDTIPHTDANWMVEQREQIEQHLQDLHGCFQKIKETLKNE